VLCFLNDILHISIPEVAAAVSDALLAVILPPLLAPLTAGSVADGDEDGTAARNLSRGGAIFGLSRLVHCITHADATSKLLDALGLAGVDSSASPSDIRTALACLLCHPEEDMGAVAATIYLLASACAVPEPSAEASAQVSASWRSGADDLVRALIVFLDAANRLTTSADTPPGDVAALLPVAAAAGWTLTQLLPAVNNTHNEGAPHRVELRQLCERSAATWVAFTNTALTGVHSGPWADAVLPVAFDTWRGLWSRAYGPPVLGDTAVAGALVRCARVRSCRLAPPGGDAPTAVAVPGGGNSTRPEAESTSPGTEQQQPHNASSDDADAMVHTVRAWVVWHVLHAMLCNRCGVTLAADSLASALPIAPPTSPRHAAAPPSDALPSEFCDGFTLPADNAVHVPRLESGPTAGADPAAAAWVFTCRVSFEPGREKRLQLWAAPCGVHAVAGGAGAPLDGGGRSTRTSMLLLTETVPSGMGHTRIVRSVAPVMGAVPYIDPAHPKWMHVRVRPSVGALRLCLPGGAPVGGQVTKGGAPFATSGGSYPGHWHEPVPPLREQRRMQDGHWTLAFDTAALCADALAAVQREAECLRSECVESAEVLLAHMTTHAEMRPADD